MQFTVNIPDELLKCFRIRAYLMFATDPATPGVANRWIELVERCQHHQQNEIMEHPAHVLRLHYPKAGVHYESNPHHSVLIPLARSPGDKTIRYLFLFMCMSVDDSIKRRVLRLIFQLESLW